MIEQHRVHEDRVVVTERAVEQPAFAHLFDPGDAGVRVAVLPLADVARGRIAGVQAHQDQHLVARVQRRLGTIDLVAELEALALERDHQRMIGHVDLEGPGAAAAPGMAGELVAHQLLPLGPLIEIIRSGVDADQAFAALDEVHQGLAPLRRRLRIEFQTRRIVQADRVELLERLGIEDRVIIRDHRHLEGPGLFAHDLEGLVRHGDYSVEEPLALPEHEHLAGLLRSDHRLGRHGLRNLGDLFILQLTQFLRRLRPQRRGQTETGKQRRRNHSRPHHVGSFLIP